MVCSIYISSCQDMATLNMTFRSRMKPTLIMGTKYKNTSACRKTMESVVDAWLTCLHVRKCWDPEHPLPATALFPSYSWSQSSWRRTSLDPGQFSGTPSWSPLWKHNTRAHHQHTPACETKSRDTVVSYYVLWLKTVITWACLYAPHAKSVSFPPTVL